MKWYSDLRSIVAGEGPFSTSPVCPVRFSSKQVSRGSYVEDDHEKPPILPAYRDLIGTGHVGRIRYIFVGLTLESHQYAQDRLLACATFRDWYTTTFLVIKHASSVDSPVRGARGMLYGGNVRR
jgi:hypothetical protein